MLSREEVLQRAEYCFMVHFQLSCLQAEDVIPPTEYIKYLRKSSLKLAEDPFICIIIEEDLRRGVPDGGLSYLIALYEGFTHAFCEVLGMDVSTLRDSISPDFLKKLAAEVKVRYRRKRDRKDA